MRVLSNILLYTILTIHIGSTTIFCQNTFKDEVLQKSIVEIVESFNGDVGIYVENLATGQTACFRENDLFPTASMIKVPIMLTVFDKISTGVLDYHEEHVYRDSLLYSGVDILGSFKDGEKIQLSKLVLLMITTSDNTASLWCQKLVGTGSEVNKWLEKNGFERTQVNSRTEGREKNREKYGWGQTTPREMVELLKVIRNGEAINKAASEEMYRVLTNIYWNGEALSQIPPYVQTASKQGAVSNSRSEVVLVNAPSGDYVFSIITNNQDDKSWDYDNEGFRLIRSISAMLWEYFEPQSEWKPATNSNAWSK